MDGIYVARPLALFFLLSGLPFLISLFQKKKKIFISCSLSCSFCRLDGCPLGGRVLMTLQDDYLLGILASDFWRREKPGLGLRMSEEML